MTPGTSGATASSHRRPGEVSLRALDEIGRTAEGRDHAREAFGRGARGEGLVHGGRRLAG